MRKLRILFLTEFTKLNTGYAGYYDNLLNQLYSTGKYEIFELASYYKASDPYLQQMAQNIPWKVYANLPEGDQEDQIYKSHPGNEFGRWKFDYVCLDCQPDVVCSIKDYWMDSFIEESIYRKFFKIVIMPTLDGTPLHPEWISFYQQCDNILTYTDWSKALLEEESGGLITVAGVANPAVNVELFKPPANRKQHKQSLGLPADAFIVGMVARNQKRKLYPDVTKCFAEFLAKLDLSTRSNTYLYLHCAHPDVGFDIPTLIKSNGLAGKVLMTYFCHKCNHWFPSFYQDAITICQRCNTKSAVLSNSQIGIDKNALAAVYGLIDLYVQHVLCEGFGVPHIEAAACGCITCGTDYAGTTDILRKTESKAIPVQRFYVEAETGRNMALPDNDTLVEYINYVYSLPESIRARMSYKTVELTRKHFGSWSVVADEWMAIFDKVEIPSGNPWAGPIDYVQTNGLQCPGPDQINDEQFVSWAFAEVLHRPEWINSYRGLKTLRDLAWGRVVVSNLGFFANEMSALGGKPTWEQLDRPKLLRFIIEQRNTFNQSEQMRHQHIQQGKIV